MKRFFRLFLIAACVACGDSSSSTTDTGSTRQDAAAADARPPQTDGGVVEDTGAPPDDAGSEEDAGMMPEDSGMITARYEGEWSGTTSQSKAIAFKVVNDTVTAVRIGYAAMGASCNSEGETNNSRFSAAINQDRFDKTINGTPPVALTYTLAGTFTGAEAANGALDLMLDQNIAGQPRCMASGSGTWTASKLADIPNYDGNWAGMTSGGQAISFAVTNNEITSFEIAYDIMEMNCMRQGTFTQVLMTPALILAGEARFGATQQPYSTSASAQFQSATMAGGSIRVSVFDTSTMPWCVGDMEGTWMATRM